MPSGGHNKIVLTESARETVLRMMAEGETLKSICAAIGVSMDTLSKWRLENSTFASECSRALELGFEVDADSLKTIPEQEQDVNRARLKCDNIKWLLARRASAKYGDRMELNVTQSVDLAGALADARARGLSIRDQENIVDAELVETKQLTSDGATGLEPVVAADQEEIDDFWS